MCTFTHRRHYQALLLELEREVLPLLPFWDDWTSDETCFLSPREQQLVRKYAAQDFCLGYWQSLRFGRQAIIIQALLEKLRSHSQLFREWVVSRFLSRLVKLAKTGGDRFFSRPISELAMPPAMKATLSALKIYNLRQLAHAYQPEDLQRDGVYHHLLRFHHQYDLWQST